jgi:hypothetical protein
VCVVVLSPFLCQTQAQGKEKYTKQAPDKMKCKVRVKTQKATENEK